MDQPPCNLPEESIEFIRTDIRKCSIQLPNLEEELIDHICCMVEEHLSNGYSFEKAYAKVKKNVAIEGLKDIEIRTLLLLDKKLQSMKTTLKITGISGLIILILASIFKIMHWPGAGIVIFLAFLIFSFGYIPFLMLTVKRENLLKNNLGVVYTGILAAFTVLATILFTIMQWPLQQYMVYISWIAILWFLILLFNYAMKSDENRVLNLSVILFFTILFVSNIALYWVNLKNPKMTHYTLERDFKVSTSFFLKNSELYYQLSDTIKDSNLRENISAYKARTDSVIDQIELLKNKMFKSEGEKDAYIRQIIKKDKFDEFEEEAMKLGSKLANYRIFIVTELSPTPELDSFIALVLQFGCDDFNNPPPVVYNNLCRLVRDIRIIESELLSEIISD